MLLLEGPTTELYVYNSYTFPLTRFSLVPVPSAINVFSSNVNVFLVNLIGSYSIPTVLSVNLAKSCLELLASISADL